MVWEYTITSVLEATRQTMSELGKCSTAARAKKYTPSDRQLPLDVGVFNLEGARVRSSQYKTYTPSKLTFAK